MIKRSTEFLFLIGMYTFLSLSCGMGDKSQPIEAQKDIAEAPVQKQEPVVDNYGFEIDGILKEEKRVRKNESFYLILAGLDVNPRRIWEIQNEADKVFDASRIQPGQKYITYASTDSTNEAFRLVYHPNALDYVIIDWGDDIQVQKKQKEIVTVVKEAAGVINNSLYVTLEEEGVTPLLANELSEVYAWQIDFFRLYKGDSFKVVYEERLVDGQRFGFGRILAADFINKGKSHKVIYFEGEDRMGYFDEEGNGAQKALLKAPFTYSQRVSSRFSHNRLHPVHKVWRPHYGVDYAAPLNTPVLATGGGEVIEARRRGENGNIVKIRHNSTYTTAYLHLNGFAKGIKRGAEVKQGQVIGYVGKTGTATGYHLDYRIYRNDVPVNPLTIKLPPSEAIGEKDRATFEQVRDYMLERLANVESRTAGNLFN